MPGNRIPGAHTAQVSGAKIKQADLLITLAEVSELYHTRDSTGFADVCVDGHRETWPIRSKGFRRWLVRRFYEATQGAPNSEALQSALAIIEAKAHFDGVERPVHLRVAELGENLYLDLADSCWRAVEIGASGWRIICDPPVRFRRSAGMMPLPAPTRGGSLAELRPMVNVRSKNDLVLLAAWLLAALRGCGPYPVLDLFGEAGCAKSTLAALLRGLIDPNTVALRSPPREERDLFIAANNGHVIGLDNLSSLPTWLSDGLCRLSTGGGFGTRQLYTDKDEILLDGKRPIVLTSIEDVVTRGDLADRSICVQPDPIPDDRRRSEREICAQFEAARPRILGALLDAMGHGLGHLATTQLDRLPRMADFALWVSACEGALWEPGTFLRAYGANRDGMNETVIEGDTVATAVRSIMADGPFWIGTAGELLAPLAQIVGETATKAESWPKTGRALSGRLRRVAPNLRRVGISIIFGKRGAKARPITIERIDGASDCHNRHHRHPPRGTMATGDDGQATDNATNAALVSDIMTATSAGLAPSAGPDSDDGLSPPASEDEQEINVWTF